MSKSVLIQWHLILRKAAEQADSFEKRMAELEESFESNEKAITKVEDTLPQLLFHGHKNPKMQFFGRIHLDYWAFPKFR